MGYHAAMARASVSDPAASPPLRRGWTTGACAAAASAAAWEALLTGCFPDPVTIRLPGGRAPAFALARERLEGGVALAGIIKDAGDDPDVTHLAEVIARVRRGPQGSGVVLRGGEGVGVVTRRGLPVAVGKAAINPAPRAMICAALAEVAQRLGAPCDLDVELSIPGGGRLARRTWNPRLGIVGGLSILGTTGVVTPYSCAAWIHAIHRGVDVARAAGLSHVAASTGSTSERAVRRLYALPDAALLDMGDFAGGLLKYLRRHPVPRLTIAGGFAKLSKLAAGAMDLHSDRSRVDPGFLGALAAGVGADGQAVRSANTASLALEIAGPVLALAVAQAARQVARNMLAETRTASAGTASAGTASAGTTDAVAVDVVVVGRDGIIMARAPDASAPGGDAS